jgi:hypothetical protein
MEKYDFHRIFELDREIRRAGVDEEIITQIMAGGELIKKSAVKEKIGKFLADAMDRMDQLLPPQTRSKVRQNNACSLTGRRLETMKEIAGMDAPLATKIEQIEAKAVLGFNGNVKDYSVKLDGDRILVNFGFGRCWCHCAYAGRKVSVTYCHCCLGHVLKLLGIALKRELTGEVVGSTCSGSAPCRFVVNLG